MSNLGAGAGAMNDDAVDRELARQLAERADRYRVVEDDELEADEVDDLLDDLRPFGAATRHGQQQQQAAKGLIYTAKDTARRIRRSVSVELEREGALAESSAGAIRRQNAEAEKQAEELRHRRRQRSASAQPQQAQAEPPVESQAPHHGLGQRVPAAAPAPIEEEEEEERSCRMCLGDEGETDDDGVSLGPLIAPCSCAGSMRWVHAKCLHKWRTTSSSPSGANICGQCHFRYRLAPPKGGAALVWALNCQLLRVLLAIACVGACALALGAGSVHALRGAARVPPLQRALLWTLREPPPPYRIALAPDRPAITIEHASPHDSFPERGRPHSPSQIDMLARASIDAIRVVQETKRGDPVWYRLSTDADDEREEDDADADDEKNAPRAQVEKSIAAGPFGQLLPSIGDLWRSMRGSGRAQNGTAAAAANGTASPEGEETSEENEKDDEKARSSFPTELSGLIQQAVQMPELTSSDPLVRSGEAWRGMRAMNISHNIAHFAGRYGDPSESIMVRMLPESLGFVRFIPYSYYIYWRESIDALRLVLQSAFIGTARSAAAIALVVASRRGAAEAGWLAAKVATSALLAFLQEHMQAARTLPRILPGAPVPQRTAQRIWAGRAARVVAHASIAVFGPYWINWWGGYPVTIYSRTPNASSLMESLLFMQWGMGWLLASIADWLAALLEGHSAAARWLRARYTRGWVNADWTYYDASAAEGFRRALSGLLGDERRAAPSRFDAYQAAWPRRLLAGRVRPGEVAALVGASRHSWRAYAHLSVLLGCALLVLAAMAWLLHLLMADVGRAVLVQIRINLRQLADLFNLSDILHSVRAARRARAALNPLNWWHARARARAQAQAANAPRRPNGGVRARLNPMLDFDERDAGAPARGLRLRRPLHEHPDPAAAGADGADAAHPPPQQPPRRAPFPEPHEANIELHLAGVAIGFAVGGAGDAALGGGAGAGAGFNAGAGAAAGGGGGGGAGNGNGAPGDRPRSRLSLAIAHLMTIYGSVHLLMNLTYITLLAAPFSPFIYFYMCFRALEKFSRTERDVLDLAARGRALGGRA